MQIFSVSDRSFARSRQAAWASRRPTLYWPFQLKPMPLPRIICTCRPSLPMGAHTSLPMRCMGTLTSSTVAPSPARRSPAARTLASTPGSELGQPNPSVTTPMRRPRTPRSSASV